MSVAQLDSDTSDSEVFVIKQIKPVNKLTLQQALLIKHDVLNSFQSKNGSKKKKKKQDLNNKKLKESVSKKTKEPGNKKSSTKKNVKKVKPVDDSETPPTLNEKKAVPMIGVFKIVKTTPEKKMSVDDSENIKLSPGISRKRKKFNIPNTSTPKSKKVNKKSPSKAFVKLTRIQGKKNLITAFNSEISNNGTEIPVKSETETQTLIKEDETNLRNVENGKCAIKEENIVEIKMEEDDMKMSDEVNRGEINDYMIVLKSYKEIDKSKHLNNSQLLSFILKKIIHDEIEKQIELQIKSSKLGRKVENLISENECEILEKFFHIPETACQIFVRMLCRKKGWHRVSAINYNDISENLKNEFEILHEASFVDVNIEDEDIKTQMDLLLKNEVQILCKAFNVSVKHCNTNKKEVLIKYLIEDSKSQKSVADMLQSSKIPKRMSLLRSEVKNYLGMCVRLNEKALSVFTKILLLFSFPHYTDEEEKRFSNQLYQCLNVFKNFMRFPSYKLSPTVIFETALDFEKYQEAVLLRDAFESAINNKGHEEFQNIANKAKVELKQLLDDPLYKSRLLNVEPFLQKFSAGSIYSRILTRYCKTLKKNTDPKELVTIAKMLLSQNVFMTSKRGEWYEILVKSLERLKDNSAAAEALIQSQKDPQVNEVQKLALQLRGQAILKKKTNAINGTSLRELLDDLCTTSVQEPPSIEIKGKPLQGNKSGFKSIYIEESENGRKYTSVEERAISYYKSIGFTNGYHVEGVIIQSIYFLLFFDIIYERSPPGVFQSYYQDAPLDLNSKYFYLNRKDAIDLRIEQIRHWDLYEVDAMLRDVYYKNYETSCGIVWSEAFTPELYCDIIKCITPPVLALICQRFVENFRLARSGFPDLTLWNSEKGKCKFVEVKSPNDKLSPAQRVWLDYLRSVGVDCEVCNVKNTSVKVFS